MPAVRRLRPAVLWRNHLQRDGRVLPPRFEHVHLPQVRPARRALLREPALRRHGHLLSLQHQRRRESLHALRDLDAAVLRRQHVQRRELLRERLLVHDQHRPEVRGRGNHLQFFGAVGRPVSKRHLLHDVRRTEPGLLHVRNDGDVLRGQRDDVCQRDVPRVRGDGSTLLRRHGDKHHVVDEQRRLHASLYMPAGHHRLPLPDVGIEPCDS
jgi:hypothetical protein